MDRHTYFCHLSKQARDVVLIAKANGFKLVNFYMGQRLFFLLEKLLGNILVKNINQLEKRILSVKWGIPVQNVYYLFQKVEDD